MSKPTLTAGRYRWVLHWIRVGDVSLARKEAFGFSLSPRQRKGVDHAMSRWGASW